MRSRALTFLAIVLLAAGIFAMDLRTPRGVSGWVWYVIPLLVSVYIHLRYLPLFLAGAFTILVTVGYFFAPAGIDPHVAMISRGFGICVLWLIAGVLSQQINTEIALRQSERTLRAIVEDQSEMIVRWKPDGTRTFVNQAYCRLVGQKRNQLIGTSFFPLLAEEDREHLQKKINSFKPSDSLATDIRRCLLPGGDVAWQEWIDRGFFDDDGRLVEVQSVGRDITEQERVKQALLKSETDFRTIFENAALSIALADMNGRLIKANPAFERFLGYTEKELIGVPIANLTYPDDVAVGAALYQELTTGQRKLYKVEKRYVRKSGEPVWGRVTVSLVPNLEPDKQYSIGMIEDISDRKQLEEQLRQFQKMEAMGRLAGGIAHDFNNLLTVIHMNSELVLMDKDRLSEQSREFLKEITSATARGSSLTRQLLVFSRKQLMHAQPLNLNEVITNLTKMLQRVIGENIQLKCNYAQHPPMIMADLGMVEQVLVNLVINARDAMPKGGQVLVSTELVTLDDDAARTHAEARAGEFVCLTVADTGTGIDPQNLPRIFEPFFTTKEEGKGTGLGLATVHGIVKQHEGWIQLSSRLGAGTIFKIFLPICQWTDTGEPVKETVPSRPRGGNETILLVEDDAAVQMLDRRTLENFGYTVHAASSGPEALQVWEQHAAAIDLLLTDIIMPGGMSGRELAEQLRAERPELKVVLTSGYSPDIAGKNIDFVRQTGSHFLQKPYTSHALAAMVRTCLDENSPNSEGARE
jgi:two-component system cell cycle sensor histidine kinase/response regulator CckA